MSPVSNAAMTPNKNIPQWALDLAERGIRLATEQGVDAYGYRHYPGYKSRDIKPLDIEEVATCVIFLKGEACKVLKSPFHGSRSHFSLQNVINTWAYPAGLRLFVGHGAVIAGCLAVGVPVCRAGPLSPEARCAVRVSRSVLRNGPSRGFPDGLRIVNPLVVKKP
jgi:hypothetical protein